ncbi:MAG: GNAT family N-acetyltransferase [Spirosomaceae bacterium]|nr:GNAT family N-acetyltransferase [Spirosomataceae bacterium]
MFQTNRLIIRPTNETDATFLVDLMNSPGWLEFIGDRQVYTESDAISYIKARITPQFDRLGYGNYTIIKKADSVKIGSCGLYDREGLAGIDIGYALLPDFQGKGYAFEAVNELKNIAFNQFNLPEIKAITNKENLPSQQLLKKIGLTFKSYIILPHEAEEILLFSSVYQNSSHST